MCMPTRVRAHTSTPLFLSHTLSLSRSLSTAILGMCIFYATPRAHAHTNTHITPRSRSLTHRSTPYKHCARTHNTHAHAHTRTHAHTQKKRTHTHNTQHTHAECGCCGRSPGHTYTHKHTHTHTHTYTQTTRSLSMHHGSRTPPSQTPRPTHPTHAQHTRQRAAAVVIRQGGASECAGLGHVHEVGGAHSHLAPVEEESARVPQVRHQNSGCTLNLNLNLNLIVYPTKTSHLQLKLRS